MEDAIAILPESQRSSPKFIIKIINGLLDTANSEYTAAISNNKITAAIEYQDSRGFVIYADELYQMIAPDVKKTDPKIDEDMQKNLTQLKEVWPSVEPPATPVKTPAEVTILIKNIEKSLKPIITKP